MEVADLGAVEAAHAGGDGWCGHDVFRWPGLCARWLFVAIPDRSGRRGRSPDLRIPAPCVPLFAGLAPDVDREVLERHRQRAAAQPARPQPLRDPLRRRVAGVDAVDDVVPAQVLEGPVDGSGAHFRCVALASGTRVARSEEHTSELQSLMRISYAV